MWHPGRRHFAWQVKNGECFFLRSRLPHVAVTGSQHTSHAFDAHAVKVLRVEKTAKKASESQKGLFWNFLAYLQELEQRKENGLH